MRNLNSFALCLTIPPRAFGQQCEERSVSFPFGGDGIVVLRFALERTLRFMVGGLHATDQSLES